VVLIVFVFGFVVFNAGGNFGGGLARLEAYDP
jgi:hypothetical protein